MKKHIICVAAAVAFTGLMTSVFAAAEPRDARERASLKEGTLVRIEGAQIEPGVREGTLRRAANRCWMVFLNQPTPAGYTAVSLTIVDRLQVAKEGRWVAIPFAATLKDQPQECFEANAD
jgi:hypothetical protein